MDHLPVYDKLIIFYFTGTGNARNASQWIIDVARELGMEAGLINIDRFETFDSPELTPETLVGICSPTHGFNLPPNVLKFIRKFPKAKQSDAFILNTRAGLKLGRLFVPGVSGVAQLLPTLMLKLKGFRIVGMQPLDLPSNWLFLHPGLRKNTVDSIYTRCKQIVIEFSLRILSGKKSYKALRSIPLDLAFVPLSFGYYIIGRFFFAKTLIATDICNNCEKCVIQCPVNAVSMVNDRPFWSYKCESCMRCVNACSQRAIETTHAFSISLIIISSLVISPLLIIGLQRIGAWDLINHSVISKNLWTLVNGFFFLLYVFLSYRLLHYLMKFKFINRLIAYTSLSKYKFWRRYKAPKTTQTI